MQSLLIILACSVGSLLIGCNPTDSVDDRTGEALKDSEVKSSLTDVLPKLESIKSGSAEMFQSASGGFPIPEFSLDQDEIKQLLELLNRHLEIDPNLRKREIFGTIKFEGWKNDVCTIYLFNGEGSEAMVVGVNYPDNSMRYFRTVSVGQFEGESRQIISKRKGKIGSSE